MKRFILTACLALANPAHADTDPRSCTPPGCRTTVLFASTSDSRSYGLLVAAPEAGCDRVRFRIEHDRAGVLGQSPPLAPGELAVIRLGQGFPQGENLVTIASIGCDMPPAEARRVILANSGHDHSWRAGRVLNSGSELSG
ncbi:MAG: hypothetical protein ACK4IU_11000 [Tabrizicola flagellatus]|uniref:hypothetical protein n=1 Tax=Tabrizicola flagellatus TaxID=2593021 RepID=UPI00391C6F65